MSTNKADTILIGGPEKRPIEIVDYDPFWPRKFDQHAGRIGAALGSDLLRIEHIGSTSVPGLAAKPIVDILVVVKDSSNEDSYLRQLEAAGYSLRVREPGWHEHRMFRTPDRDVHVHVYSERCAEIERNLIFRDHLRDNDADRKLYEETKRRLAVMEWADTNQYAEAKTPIINRIIAAARAQQPRGGDSSGGAGL